MNIEIEENNLIKKFIWLQFEVTWKGWQ